MAKDYIPDPDATFDGWLVNFYNQLKIVGPAVGLAQSVIHDVEGATSQWATDYHAQIAAKNAARAATETKDESRDDTEKLVRSVVRQLQANPQLTDAQRELLGITVPDTTPTPQSPDYVLSVPPPLQSLDFSQRQQITNHFGTNPENESENAKPDGIAGAKIWFRLIEPRGMSFHNVSKFLDEMGHVDWNEWQFLADDTNSPYVHVIETTVPITLEYRAQWFDNSMRLGPLGDPVRATVTP